MSTQTWLYQDEVCQLGTMAEEVEDDQPLTAVIHATYDEVALRHWSLTYHVPVDFGPVTISRQRAGYECVSCSHITVSWASCVRHYVLTHSTKRGSDFVCSYPVGSGSTCNKVSPELSLALQCSVLSFQTLKRTSLFDHHLVHSRAHPVCSTCGAFSFNDRTLKQHKARVHGQ